MRACLTLLAVLCIACSAWAGESTGYTGKDAMAAISQELIKEGAGDALRVQINGIREEDILAPAGKIAITGEISELQLDKAKNRWQATLLLSTGGQNLSPVKLAGKYDEMVHIPTLKQRAMHGDIITEEDITWEDMPATRVHKGTVMDSSTLVGKSPRRVISAGRPVRLEEIVGPTVVTKGSQVTLVYKTPHLEIKTLGEALEDGAHGAVIRVRNTASKSVIQGVVESEGLVRIGTPEDLSAKLM